MMTKKCFQSLNSAILLILLIVTADYFRQAIAADNVAAVAKNTQLLLRAARVFNGNEMINDAEVLISGNKIIGIGKSHSLKTESAKIIELGDSTLLPGLIELHSHIDFQKVPKDVVLKHGITTARDVGGKLLPVSGGDGNLRLLTAGSILTAVNGYPVPVFGKTQVATEVENAEQARQLVRDFIKGGAVVIKVALDSGEENGARWTNAHQHSTTFPKPWAMLSLEILQAITDETHKLGKKVSAHVGENKGVTLALEANVDEWAHIPCEPIDADLLKRAVAQKVRIVSTLDVLSHCTGIYQNTSLLASLGAQFLYGAEVAHSDIPWGIDAQELTLMQHLTGMTPLQVLQTATVKAGDYLGLASLGTLTTNAPADIIAVRGNAIENFKLLEYPDLVISGGKIVVNHYAQ